MCISKLWDWFQIIPQTLKSFTLRIPLEFEVCFNVQLLNAFVVKYIDRK